MASANVGSAETHLNLINGTVCKNYSNGDIGAYHKKTSHNTSVLSHMSLNFTF